MVMLPQYGGFQNRRLQDKPLTNQYPQVPQPLTGQQPLTPKAPMAGAPGAPQLPSLTPRPLPGMPMIGPTSPGLARPGTATTLAGQQPMLPHPQPQPQGLNVTGANVGPTAPQGQSGPLTNFGPGNDLLSTQVNPTTGERLGGVQSGNDVLYKALTQGPNLQQSALDAFKNIQGKTAEQRQLGIQDIGRSAARLGRLGSGMVTTDLGNLEDTLRSHENQALGDLAYNTATQEAGDRRANLGAGQGYESQVYGQGQNARNEVRTERDYQAQQSQQALQNEIVRRQLQAQYQQYLASLGLQGAGLYGDQAAASQGAASSLLGF